MSSKENTPENNKETLTRSEIYKILDVVEKIETFNATPIIIRDVRIKIDRELSLKQDSTPEENLTAARNYLKDLELPQGFEFVLQHNGENTMVLEDVSDELKERISAYQEKVNHAVDDHRDCKKCEDEFKQVREYNKDIHEKTNARVKAPAGDSIKKEFLKNQSIKEDLNRDCREWARKEVKSDAIATFLKDIHHRELTINDVKDILVILNTDYMTSPQETCPENRAYIGSGFTVLYELLNNIEDE